MGDIPRVIMIKGEVTVYRPKHMENQIQPDNLMTAQQYDQMAGTQSLPLGIIGGLVGAAIGAALWAVITMVTDYQIGWMAIGIGFLTGLGMRTLGKGRSPVFGIVGALLALVGVVVGNLIVIHLVMQNEFPGFQLAPNEYIEVLTSSLQPMDYLFYGLALFTGFRASIAK
jgi:hypothetical protein